MLIRIELFVQVIGELALCELKRILQVFLPFYGHHVLYHYVLVLPKTNTGIHVQCMSCTFCLINAVETKNTARMKIVDADASFLKPYMVYIPKTKK